MAKLHFRPYISNQTVLFSGRIDENIAADDPVRMVISLDVEYIDGTKIESKANKGTKESPPRKEETGPGT